MERAGHVMWHNDGVISVAVEEPLPSGRGDVGSGQWVMCQSSDLSYDLYGVDVVLSVLTRWLERVFISLFSPEPIMFK